MHSYRYSNAEPTWSNAYLWPVVSREISLLPNASERDRRVFDLGCGNGATSGMLAERGYEVTGVDISESGIAHAKSAFPRCRFEAASVYDDLAAEHGQFPIVVSLEVVEHLYDPRRFARNLHALVAPGGTAIVSAPYHGYLKNLALAASGKLDRHFTALWDGGHIKFFSIDTLGALLREAGFAPIRFHRAGRIPPLAKSMVAVVKKPAAAPDTARAQMNEA